MAKIQIMLAMFLASIAIGQVVEEDTDNDDEVNVTSLQDSELYFESNLAVDCRRKCLNKGGIFCTNADYSQGRCCP